MWELNSNGTLMNSYSGSCASLKVRKANAGSGGVRSWIATGKKGKMIVFDRVKSKGLNFWDMSD